MESWAYPEVSSCKLRVDYNACAYAGSGLVTSEKVGRSVIYRLADSRVVPLLDLACEVATPHAEHLATCTRIGPDWV